MTLRPVKIAIADEAELEQRARTLARGEIERDATPIGNSSVTFRLGAARCAIEASAVHRVVLRLAAVFAIPVATGGERAAAFIDERPLPVVDLLRPGRVIEVLRDAPALIITAEYGPIAVAVEGPLDLTEAAMRQTAERPPRDGDDPPLLGRLADGTALLDASWIRRFAARALAS